MVDKYSCHVHIYIDVLFYMAQLMPLPFAASCFSKIQFGFIFLVQAHLGSPGKNRPLNVCFYSISCSGLMTKTALRKYICILDLIMMRRVVGEIGLRVRQEVTTLL